MTLPLLVLAVILALVSSAMSLMSKPKRVAPVLVSHVVVVFSSLAIAVVLNAYFYTIRWSTPRPPNWPSKRTANVLITEHHRSAV